jgi:starch synthase
VLSRGALQLCKALAWYPDIIHANDWQTGMLPGYLNTVERHSPLGRAACVFTIHNLGYQGRFPADSFGVTGLPWELFTFLDYEYWDSVNLLKGAIKQAAVITTVSPSYAREDPVRRFTEGGSTPFCGALRRFIRDSHGIDDQEWKSRHGSASGCAFLGGRSHGKSGMQAALQRELGLPPFSETPLVGNG